MRRSTLVLFASMAASGCGGATVGASPAPTPLAVIQDRVDGRSLLAPDAKRAIEAGAGPLELVGADVAADGDRVGAFVELPADACVVAFTRGSRTIHDADIFAFADDGSTFASDESPRKGGALLLCPPLPRRLYVAGRVVSGAGVLAVGVHEVPLPRAEQVAQAVGVRSGSGEESGRLDSWPGLEAKVNRHRRALGSTWEDIRRVAIPIDPRAPSQVSLSIDAGRCLDLLVVPSDEVASVDVSVHDEDGRIIARARSRGRDSSLVLCSAETQTLHVGLRPRSAQGLAAVVIGRSEVGAEKELEGVTTIHRVTETRPLAEARRAHEAALAKLRYEPGRVLGQGEAKVGHRVGFDVELPAGCARVDVVAGAPAGALSAAIWDDAGHKLAEDDGPRGATLHVCGERRRARVDVEALTRPGPFLVELFGALDAPPPLLAHPLLASRLLERLESPGEPIDASRATGAKVVDLAEGLAHKLPLVVPAGRCMEVAAAVGDSASGVELRWASGGDPTSVRRGHRSVAERFCAGSTARAGAVEITLGQGSSEALVLTRDIP